MTAQESHSFSQQELNLILSTEPDFFVDLTVGDHVFDALRELRAKLSVPQHIAYLHRTLHMNCLRTKFYTVFVNFWIQVLIIFVYHWGWIAT